MRFLVTGGAGFIGSALVRRLAADGHEVVVLDDMSRGRPDRLAGVRCEIRHGDIRDPGTVDQAMQGCESVIHLAYIQGTQTFYAEPRLILDVALRGILNVLDACRTTGCRELLLVSSSEAYETPPAWPTPEDVPLVVPDPLNPRFSYGGGKIASELAALAWQRTGILDRLIIVRPHNVYGPDMGTRHVIPEFCERMNTLIQRPEYDGARAGCEIPFPIQGSGQETRSFCWIGDCTGQFMTLLARAPRGAEIYHLGTMEERAVADVARRVASCYGREIKIEPGILPKGSPSRRLPDISKIMALGYEGPQVSFAEGVARTVDWYREHA
jgi:nucleoside-diphosphate-sugar epimerase